MKEVFDKLDQNKVCLYCHSKLELNQYDSNRVNSNYFHCPNKCMTAWYDLEDTTCCWGFKILLPNKLCLRLYRDWDRFQIFKDVPLNMVQIPAFPFLHYSLTDLARKIKGYLIFS